MDVPRLYVDFNEMVDRDLVLLSQANEKRDSVGNVIQLHEGMTVHVFMDDPDVDGSPGALIADGIVERNRTGGWTSAAKWCCRIDSCGIRRWPRGAARLGPGRRGAPPLGEENGGDAEPKGVTLMSRLRVNAFSISIDGYGAGPDQALENPMGVGGMALHQWVLGTKTFQKMAGDFAGSLIGDKVAREDVDDDFAARSFDNLGAWIMGRNMFAPSRGPWPDDGWKGWWGNNPPYHVPVFVLTHHARAPLTMEGGTTFHFVTDGIHAALKRAKEAARGKDVRLGGGSATIRQYLAAGLIDEIHLAISPVLLGRGEHLLAGIDMVSLGYKCTEHASTSHATHVVLAK